MQQTFEIPYFLKVHHAHCSRGKIKAQLIIGLSVNDLKKNLFCLCSVETLLLAQELVQVNGLECGPGLDLDWSWIGPGLECGCGLDSVDWSADVDNRASMQMPMFYDS